MGRGYTQRKFIDYEEVFSLVMRFASIRLLLEIMVRLHLKLFQIDVKTIFPNDSTRQRDNMKQPIRFEVKRNKHNCAV